MGIPKITQMAINAALSGGGGKREGTAIPVGRPVDMIYFNCHNTMDETNEILSQLTYVDIGFGAPMYIAYATLETETSGTVLAVLEIDHDAKQYTIVEVKDLSTLSTITYFWGALGNRTEGWQILSEQPFMEAYALIAGVPVLSWGQSLTEFNGIPVGAENEKIKNVLSITPF